MVKSESVLVTGAAGFIGSHCVLELLNAGYEVVAIDNFINAVSGPGSTAISLQRVEELTGKPVPFHCVDITNAEALRTLFKQCRIDCVMHLAALKAVGESCEKPLEYYSNNLTGSIRLLQVMREFNVKKFIFSSSATVYGLPSSLPVKEEHSTGAGLTNPYGKSKFFVEQMLMDLCKADKEWNMILLRYFNPVGAHPSGRIGEDPKGTPANLMPYVSQVAIGKLPFVPVFGHDYDTPDGTGVRDYIHIMDLASGHVAAIKKVDEDAIGCKVYNLGTGRGNSVLEMIAAMEKATGFKIAHKLQDRRPGDIAAVYCDPGLAAIELGWKCKFGLDEMCRDMWNWQKLNPNGFEQTKQ